MSGVLDLAGSCGPFRPSPRALAAARQALRDVHLYPDEACEAFRRAAAARHGVPPSRILPGNGSDEVLELLLRHHLRDGGEIVLPQYSYARMRHLARQHGGTVAEAPARGLRMDLDAVAAAVTPRTRLVVLGSPNNPTGECVPRDALGRLLSALPQHVAMVLDEAHVEFAEADVGGDARTLGGVAVAAPIGLAADRPFYAVRSLSKALGLAALRVGYAVGPVEPVAALRSPHNVNGIAQAAAVAALADEAHLERVRRGARAGRRALARLLAGHGWTVHPSEAGFVLVEIPGGALPMARALAAAGVRIRALGDWGFPEAFARVAVGPPWTVRRLAEALEAVYGEGRVGAAREATEPVALRL